MSDIGCSLPLRDRPDIAAFYRRKRVLVAGADGFLGFNCVLRLGGLGAHVSISARRPFSRAAAFANEVFNCDLRAPVSIAPAISRQSIVFDFAGVSSAVASNRNPAASLDDDCRAQLNLIEACAQAASPVVVLCSSRLVYGKPQYLPVDEKHVLAPESMYAVHKISAEHYLQVFGQMGRLQWCVLRLSNPFGPHQPRGEAHHGVINRFIQAACAGKPIRIYGNGQQRRDYIYIDDVITVFLLCAVSESAYGQTFNLGGASSISLDDAAATISAFAEAPPVQFEPWPESYRSVETGDYASNVSKLRRYLDLPPQIPFEEGILRSLQHYGSCQQSARPSSPDGPRDQGSVRHVNVNIPFRVER